MSFKQNLGRRNVDKFAKICKISFSVECFTADFLRFFTEKRQNLALVWAAGYSLTNPSISGFFFLRFSVLNHTMVVTATRETTVHSHTSDNNLVTFHLRWREIALISEIYNSFLQDRLKIFLFVFTCLKMHRNPRNGQFLVEKINTSS